MPLKTLIALKRTEKKEMATNLTYKHSDLTDAIIGVFYEVYKDLGFGFLESVYRKALKLALEAKGLKAATEVPVPVFFRGKNVGDFRADLVVNQLITRDQDRRKHYCRARSSIAELPAGNHPGSWLDFEFRPQGADSKNAVR